MAKKATKKKAIKGKTAAPRKKTTPKKKAAPKRRPAPKKGSLPRRRPPAKKAAPATSVEQRAGEIDINSMEYLRSFGFPIPRTFEAQRKKVLELRETGEESQKHLGILLTVMRRNEIHLNEGFSDFVEFLKEKMGLAKGSANNAMNTLKMHSDMGIAPDVFRKLGQGHIHQMFRAYAKGVINKSGVRKLLPLATMGNKQYVSRDKFKSRIDEMLKTTAGATGAVLKSFAIKPDSGEAQEMIESCLGTLKKHPVYRDFSQSQILEKALVEFSANHSGDEGAAKFATLASSLDLTASLTPVGAAPVMIVIDPQRMDEAGLGKVKSKLVTMAYMGFGKGDYSQKLVLTTNKTRASKVMSLGEKQIREIALEVDPAILPKMLHKHFETVAVTIQPDEEKAPDLIEAARLVKMRVEDVRKYADKLGYDVTPGAKKESLLRILFADQELYGFGDQAIEDLIAEMPEKREKAKPKKAPAKKKAAPKPRKKAAPKAAPKKTEPEEEGEEEEGEEEGEEESAKMSQEDKTRHNLDVLKKNGVITRADFAEQYNSLPQSMNDKDKYAKIYGWTQTIAGSERAKKIIKDKNLTIM